MKSGGQPTLRLLLRTLALFAFLLVIWPTPPAQAVAPEQPTSGR